MGLFEDCIEYVEATVMAALDGCDPMPHISIGGSTVDHPFEVYVCEEPQSVEISDVSTSHMGMGAAARGLYRVEFSVMIQFQAKGPEAWEASRTALGWFERLACAVANDKTLGGLCLHAQPYLTNGATGSDGRTWVHVTEGGVRIKADINPKRQEA